MEFGHGGDSAFAINSMFDRVKYPARGRRGGEAGRTGIIYLKSRTTRLPGKGQRTIPRGDRLVLEMPGGGGLGDPLARSPQRVAEDVRNGFVSVERARIDYGVIVNRKGKIDLVNTRLERQSRRSSESD